MGRPRGQSQFAERILSPGSLVATTGGTPEAYIFPTLNTQSSLKIAGECYALSGNEPLLVISAFVGSDTVYCYVLGRSIIGWLPTWEGDGVVELIQRA